MCETIQCPNCFFVRAPETAACPVCAHEDSLEDILLDIIDELESGKGVILSRYKERLKLIIKTRKENRP